MQEVEISEATSGDELFDIIEIRDPEIDVHEIVDRIRMNMARRKQLPPLAAAFGRVKAADQRQKLLASIKELRTRIREYGMVDSHKGGWLTRLDVFVKKTIRRLMLRHILQQHRIHLKLHTVLDQLVQYLEDEDNCLRTCVDRVQRQCQDAA
jgi:hypothetical protein